jgi:hypothetical protein
MTLPEPAPGVQVAANARCATCAAALAPDQMFCLSCGTRRRDARIAFRDVLATEAAPVVTPLAGGAGGWPPHGAAEAAHGPVGPGRISYVPFIATLGLLLFALVAGVWIGREPATAAAPVAAFPVQGAVATTPATTPADGAAAADEQADEEADEGDQADEAESDEAVAPVKDDTSALKNLEKLSPEEYQKQAQKLPSEIGTGGTPPPKDNKPAGGGSEFESFE